MILHDPIIITARLMLGVRISEHGYISLGLGPRNAEGRTEYQCWIDLPDGSEHEITGMRSGCQGGEIQEGLATLLSFLGAAAESRQYHERTGRQGENEDLFAAPIVEWAAQNSDEIGMLAMEIEETPDLIED